MLNSLFEATGNLICFYYQDQSQTQHIVKMCLSWVKFDFNSKYSHDFRLLIHLPGAKS